MTPSPLVFGLDRLCPSCKGRGQIVNDGPGTRPARPSDVKPGSRHGRPRAYTCTRCAGAGVVR